MQRGERFVFRKQNLIMFFLIFLISFQPVKIFAEETKDIYKERLALYKKTEALTQIPWYYIAAVDQYERNIQTDLPSDQLVSINIQEETWFGPGNTSFVMEEHIIDMFGGIGKDGNGDGKADPENPEDILYTLFQMISKYGLTEDDIKIGLFDYYKRDLTVKTIINTAKVFKNFKDIHL